MVGYDGSQGGEEWSQKHTNFPHIDGHIKVVQKVVYDTSCDHETRVDGATNDPSKGIPSSVIKPVVEIIGSFLSQVLVLVSDRHFLI